MSSIDKLKDLASQFTLGVRRAFAGEELCLSTMLTPCECTEHLTQDLASTLQLLKVGGVYGKVDDSGFALQSVSATIPLGNFAPVTVRRYEQLADRTQIRVRIATRKRMLLLGLPLVLVGVVFWSVALVRLISGQSALGSEPVAWLLGMAFLPLMIWFFVRGFWVYATVRDQETISYIVEALNAQEESCEK
jgi:hypothetical protein